VTTISHPPKAHGARAGGASLDVLRFLAAGFILLFHFGESAPRSLRDMSPLFAQGWLATDFFLLLSGFILMRAYGPRLAAGRVKAPHFVIRRIMRLWPSHVVVLLLMLALVGVATLAGHPPGSAEKYGAFDFWAQLFLVHNWGLSAEPSWNVPTWTLSALLICYGLFSLYAGAVCGWSRGRLQIALLVVLAVAEGAAALIGHPFVDLPFRWGLVRAIPLFVAGSLLERLIQGVSVSPRAYFAGLAAALAGVAGLALLPRVAGVDLLILAGLAAVLGLSASVVLPETGLTKRMGRAAYALFLTHSLIGALALGFDTLLMRRFNLPEPVHWLYWLATLAGAVLFAFVFEALIDRPLSERVTRWLNRLDDTRRASI